MTKALNTVKKLCHNVDIMVEVRDARVEKTFIFDIDSFFVHQQGSGKVFSQQASSHIITSKRSHLKARSASSTRLLQTNR